MPVKEGTLTAFSDDSRDLVNVFIFTNVFEIIFFCFLSRKKVALKYLVQLHIGCYFLYYYIFFLIHEIHEFYNFFNVGEFSKRKYCIKSIASKREPKQAIRGECFGHQTCMTPKITFKVQLGKFILDVCNIFNVLCCTSLELGL